MKLCANNFQSDPSNIEKKLLLRHWITVSLAWLQKSEEGGGDYSPDVSADVPFIQTKSSTKRVSNVSHPGKW